MCTVLLPPGVYPPTVKYIISYHILLNDMSVILRRTRLVQ